MSSEIAKWIFIGQRVPGTNTATDPAQIIDTRLRIIFTEAYICNMFALIATLSILIDHQIKKFNKLAM